MVYYITKTNPNLAHLPLDERVFVLPLITLQTKFIEDIKEKLQACDSLIFTSKNAIYALSENLKFRDFKSVWASLPNFVIGKGSADALESLGFKAHFVASSAYGEVFARELIPHLKHRQPLFVRAKKIASKLPEILRNDGIYLQEVIVYESLLNLLESPPKLQKNSIIIFGAPSHIRAFLLNFTWDLSFCALCIGKTTSAAAIKLLGEEAKIMEAPIPEFKSVLEFALNIYKN